MPRVHIVKSARPAKRARRCHECHKPIEVGQSFYTWQIKSTYGGTKYFRHIEHGGPKPYHLTHSKLADVYMAQEEAEKELGFLDRSYSPERDLEGEVTDILNTLSEAVQGVADEYREAAEAMGGAGYQNEERADELEAWVQDLEGFSPSFDVPEPPSDDPDTIPCVDCSGTGSQDDESCDECSGTGQVDNTSETDQEQFEADWDQYVESLIDEALELVNNCPV